MNDAFFPLKGGKVAVWYSWYDATWWGLKKEYVEVEYDLNDPCVYDWFYKNGYGLMKETAL